MPEFYYKPSIGRDIDTQVTYMKHLIEKRETRDDSCDLCASVERQRDDQIYPKIGGRALILANEYFTAIENDFPYSVYDGREILAHHMLVPREHISYNQILRDKVLRHELIDAEYELHDLSEYAYGTTMARTSNNVASSIPDHAHMHLFRTGSPIVEQHFSMSEKRNDFTIL